VRRVQEEGTPDLQETRIEAGSGEQKLIEAGVEGWSAIGGGRQGKRCIGRRGHGVFGGVTGGYYGILGDSDEDAGEGALVDPSAREEVEGEGLRPPDGERAVGRGGIKGVKKHYGSKGMGELERGKGASSDFDAILAAAREQFEGEKALEGEGARGAIMEQGATWVRAWEQRGTKTVAEGGGVSPKTGMVELANRYERIRAIRGMIAADVAWGVLGWGIAASDIYLGRFFLVMVIQLLRIGCITKFLCMGTTAGRVDSYLGSTVQNMNWCRGRNKLGKRGVERGIT
jgi:hypothetical protein